LRGASWSGCGRRWSGRPADGKNRATSYPNKLTKKDWPPMNADERRLKISKLSALIGVYRRLKLGFSIAEDILEFWSH
jgi:hypothetical protein